MKIDRVVQKVKYIGEGNLKNKIITKDYILSPETENNIFSLKTNIGKTLNNGINNGVIIEDFNFYNNSILDGLHLELICNKTIEFCIDIPTTNRMIENKIFSISFHNALTQFGCHRINNTFKAKKGIYRDKQPIIGVKGFSKGNHTSFKLYSKQEEREVLNYTKDIIRFEIICDTYSLSRLGLDKKVSNDSIDQLFLVVKNFMSFWRSSLGKRKNRYTIKVHNLIDEIEKKLEK